MTDIDKQIEAALAEEDRDIMDRFGEQGLFEQTFSVYRGKQAWIAFMATAVMFVLFGFALYSGTKFVNSDDPIVSMQWAAGTWFLMTMVAFMKVWFWMRMESNRVLREIKRVELQIARLHSV